MILMHSIRSVMRQVYSKEMIMDPSNVPELYLLLQKAERRMKGEELSAWSAEEIVNDMTSFSGHESLLKEGEVRHGIASGSEFTDYLCRLTDSDPASFNKMMYNVFKLLYLAASVDPDLKERFFYSFPPVGEEELQCMAGSIARFESIFNTIKDKTTLEEAFYQCHENDVMPILNQRAIQHFDDYVILESDDNYQLEDYHVHIPEYLKYMFLFLNDEESGKVDSNYYLISDMLFLEAKADYFQSYGKIFNEKILANRADPLFLQDWSQRKLQNQINDAIDLANKSSSAHSGEKIPEGFDFYGVSFDEYCVANTADHQARIFTFISDLISRLKMSRENFLERCCDQSTIQDDNGDIYDSYKINPAKLLQECRSRNVAEFDEGFTAMQVVEFGPEDYELRGSILREEIYSDSIIGKIHEMLASKEINRIKYAIEILHLIAEGGDGSPELHFYNVISSPIGGTNIYGMLNAILKASEEYEFCRHDAEFCAAYLEKIRSPIIQGDEGAQYSKGRGILDKFDKVKEKNKEVIKYSKASRQLPAHLVVGSLEEFSTEKVCVALTRDDIAGILIEAGFDIGDLMIMIDKRGDKERLFLHMMTYCDPELLQVVVKDALPSFIDCVAENISRVDNADNINILLSAALDRPMDAEILIGLMQKDGFDINFNDHDGNTFLHKAVLSGNIDIIRALLDTIPDGYDFRVQNAQEYTALGCLCAIDPAVVRPQQIEVAKLMIDHGDSIEFTHDGAQGFLDWAIKSDPGQVTFAQKAELINAILDDDELELEIAYEADDPLDSDPLISLVETCKPITEDRLEIARKLVIFGSNIATMFDCPEISIDQKVAFVSSLEGGVYDFNTIDSLGNTPLLSAIQHADVDQAIALAKILISKGADPNARYGDLDTGYDDALTEVGVVNTSVNSSPEYLQQVRDLFKELVTGGAYLNKEIYDSIVRIQESGDGNLIHASCDLVKVVHDSLYSLRENFTADRLEDLVNSYYHGGEDERLGAKLLLTYRDKEGKMEFVNLFHRLQLLDLSDISILLKELTGQLIREYKEDLPPDFHELYNEFSSKFDESQIVSLQYQSLPSAAGAAAAAAASEEVDMTELSKDRARTTSQRRSPGDSGVGSDASGNDSPGNSGGSPDLRESKRARVPDSRSPDSAAGSPPSLPRTSPSSVQFNPEYDGGLSGTGRAR